MLGPHNCLSGEYAYTVTEGGGFPFLQLLCNLWKRTVTLPLLLTINLISRWRIPEAIDDLVRSKSMHNFKHSSFPTSLSVSSHVDLIHLFSIHPFPTP